MRVLKPVYTAKYLGGPLGGTTQVIHDLLPYLDVPVADRIVDYGVLGSIPVIPRRMYTKERYLLESRRSTGPYAVEVTYRWQNPYEGMQKEVSALRKQLAAQKTQIEKQEALWAAIEAVLDVAPAVQTLIAAVREAA